MDDWLIFQYHFIRAQAESGVLREPPSGGYRPRWSRNWLTAAVYRRLDSELRRDPKATPNPSS